MPPTPRELARRLRRGGPTADAPGPVIALDYPVSPRPRFGWGQPPHPQLLARIDRDRDRYEAEVRGYLAVVDDLRRIPVSAGSPVEPCWNNGWFQGLDVVALYSMLATRDPSVLVEIGSGHSTKVARRAVTDHGLRTSIVAIDPTPRTPVDGIVDQRIVAPLEDADLSVLRALGAGDVVAFDGSHRAFTNSDVTVFFTEVLPTLAPGVLVQVHDVFLPWDYRPDWGDRWYSEQYLLAAWLLAGDRLAVLSPNFHVSRQPALSAAFEPLWADLGGQEVVDVADPSAFWFTT
jgi:hypothetical protein